MLGVNQNANGKDNWVCTCTHASSSPNAMLPKYHSINNHPIIPNVSQVLLMDSRGLMMESQIQTL